MLRYKYNTWNFLCQDVILHSFNNSWHLSLDFWLGVVNLCYSKEVKIGTPSAYLWTHSQSHLKLKYCLWDEIHNKLETHSLAWAKQASQFFPSQQCSEQTRLHYHTNPTVSDVTDGFISHSASWPFKLSWSFVSRSFLSRFPHGKTWLNSFIIKWKLSMI